MTPQQIDTFLRRPLVITFTTLRTNGSPHTSPIWYEYDSGKLYCWVIANSITVRNVRADPRVALCIATNGEPHEYVLAEGTCEVVRDGIAERGKTIASRYYGEERGNQFVQDTMASGETVLLVVSPTRMVTESQA